MLSALVCALNASLVAAAIAAAPDIASTLLWVKRQICSAQAIAASISPGCSTAAGQIFMAAPFVASALPLLIICTDCFSPSSSPCKEARLSLNIAFIAARVVGPVKLA
ncbi:Uncharacterised protein [Salmonella enterica subsp. enterica serovar Bovismorbificans]|uniref:Secreted protein n=1 Tax=Salmonella enterica subsp. enterica serovar Bovismorbificans TaxID=58097 RepID=A0A655C3F0_SALET|nr:Uncharacterised protein [Salmonella enterica subsp. enterica serovar Bovismorbificans]